MIVVETQENKEKVIQIIQVLNLSGLENATRVAIIFITLLAALAALIRAYWILYMKIFSRMLQNFADFLRNHPFSFLLLVLIVLLVYKIIINRKLLVNLVKTLRYLLEEDDKEESLFQYIIQFFNPLNWLEWCVDWLALKLLKYYGFLEVLKKNKKLLIEKLYEKINKKTY